MIMKEIQEESFGDKIKYMLIEKRDDGKLLITFKVDDEEPREVVVKKATVDQCWIEWTHETNEREIDQHGYKFHMDGRYFNDNDGTFKEVRYKKC